MRIHGETDGSAIGGISGWTRFDTNETASAGTNSFSGWLSEVVVFDAVTNLSDYLRTHSGMGVACARCGGKGKPGSSTDSSRPCPYDPTGPTETNVHMSGYVSLSMTNFIYYNHDDDNVNGTNDVDDIGPVNDENDLVQVTVGIGLKAGEYPGTWMFFNVIGDDHVNVWDNSNKSGTAVSLPVTWQITGPSPGSTGYSTSHVYWVEGKKISDWQQDVWFRTSYRGTDPDVTRYCWTTSKNTVFDFTLEPVYEYVSIANIYNPCGVTAGDEANLFIDVYPAPLSEADDMPRWTNVVGASFNGYVEMTDDHGYMASVAGCTTGRVRIEAQIDGFAGPAPTLDMDVFSSASTVDVYVYIVCRSDGTPAWQEADVQDALRTANMIYDQVDMDFVQVGSIRYLTNNAYCDMTNEAALYPLFATTNAGTSGLEFYFLNSLWTNWAGVNVSGLTGDSASGNGLAVAFASAVNKGNVLAHEIGHACGLADIYWHSSANNIYLSGWDEPVRKAWASDDWNSGPGPLYYPEDLQQRDLIIRLLMHGIDESKYSVDIPVGQIFGMDINEDPAGCKVNVGLNDGNRNSVLNRIDPHH